MPLFNQTLFEQILGTTPTLAEIAAYDAANITYDQLGYAAPGTTYLGRFNYASEYDWTTFGLGKPYDPTAQFDTSSINIYDPAAMYYAWYKMSGYTNPVYLDRANQHNTAYRYWVSGAANYYPRADSHLTEGLALNYAATGDIASLTTLGKIADNFAGFPNAPWGSDGFGWYPLVGVPALVGEREWVRPLESFIYAYTIGAPSVGGSVYPAGGNDFRALATGCIDRILAVQGADGAWRSCAHHPINAPTPFYVKGFFTMLICNAFILYSRLIQTDARILPAIEAALNYFYVDGVYPKMWCPYPIVSPDGAVRGNAFKYVEMDTIETDVWSQGIGSNDLNGFFVQSHAWCYQQTGNPIWKTRANAIITGMQYANPNYYTKQLTESYAQFSYLAFPMLAAQAAAQTLVGTDIRDTASLIGTVNSVATTKIRLNWV